MTREDILERVRTRSWFHRIELAPGIITPGVDDTPRKASLIQFPADFRGKTVLDIGAFDGYFSFEAERRGAARVVAYDHYPPDESGFNTAKEILGSRVEHQLGSVYDLDRKTIGQFDVVLLLGVLYHLRHPLLALEKLHGVCREVMYVESQVLGDAFLDSSGTDGQRRLAGLPGHVSVAQFFPGAALGEDLTNWWIPTTACLESWIRNHGFAPTLLAEWPSAPGFRAAFRCLRTPVDLPWWVTSS